MVCDKFNMQYCIHECKEDRNECMTFLMKSSFIKSELKHFKKEMKLNSIREQKEDFGKNQTLLSSYDF